MCLVDSGAEVLVVPESYAEGSMGGDEIELHGASRQPFQGRKGSLEREAGPVKKTVEGVVISDLITAAPLLGNDLGQRAG